MILFLIGLAAFFGTHLIPAAPGLKANLLDRLGEGGYKIAFAVASGVGLVLIIIGYQNADVIPVYDPPSFARSLAHTLMPFVFILLAGANMRSNLKRFVRHPMSLGVLLWAVVHLVANGDLASIILFGAFAAFALTDLLVIASGKPAPPQQPRIKDLILVVAGLVGYGAAIYIHGWLGYPVVG